MYGKRYRPIVGNIKTLKSGKDNWIVVSEKHEPLVSQEEFEKAQAVMFAFIEKDCQSIKKHLLSGKIRCGVCGYALSRANKKAPYYYCSTRQKSAECGCMEGNIKESDLSEIILTAIRTYILVFLDKNKLKKSMKQENSICDIHEQIAEYQASITKTKDRKATLYDDYAEEKISREDYIRNRDCLTTEQKELEERIKELQYKLSKATAVTNIEQPKEDKLRQHLKADILTKDMVAYFIKSVLVYTDRSVKINWMFD